jgi:hypothetical protein
MLESLYESFKITNLKIEDAKKAKRLHAKVKLKDGTIIEGKIENKYSIDEYLLIKRKGSIFQIWEDAVGEIDLFDLDKEAETVEGGAQKSIAFDFDGVLAKYTDGQYPEIGDPILGMKDLLASLKKQGWKVIVFTCRQSAEVEPWLTQHGFEVDEINQNSDAPAHSNKVPADIYVDDRAITFTGDAEALAFQIANFKRWNEETPPELKSGEEIEKEIIVKEVKETRKVWICPNCQKEIQEKTTYSKGDKYYHNCCDKPIKTPPPTEEEKKVIAQLTGKVAVK